MPLLPLAEVPRQAEGGAPGGRRRGRSAAAQGGAAGRPHGPRARRGGRTDPEVRLLRQAFLQQESALVKMREVLARLEGRDDPPAEEPAAAGAGAQE